MLIPNPAPPTENIRHTTKIRFGTFHPQHHFARSVREQIPVDHDVDLPVEKPKPKPKVETKIDKPKPKPKTKKATSRKRVTKND